MKTSRKKSFISRALSIMLAVITVISLVSVPSKAAGNKLYRFSKPLMIEYGVSFSAKITTEQETWGKFVLKKKSKIRYKGVYEHGYPEILDADLQVVYDPDDDETKGNDGNWHFSKTMTLKKGTYYFHYTTKIDSTYGKFTIYNITKPDPPVLTSVNKKTGVIKGKGVKNGTICVKIGNATYKASISKKGKFTIKTRKMKKGTKFFVYVVSPSKLSSKKNQYYIG